MLYACVCVCTCVCVCMWRTGSLCAPISRVYLTVYQPVHLSACLSAYKCIQFVISLLPVCLSVFHSHLSINCSSVTLLLIYLSPCLCLPAFTSCLPRLRLCHSICLEPVPVSTFAINLSITDWRSARLWRDGKWGVPRHPSDPPQSVLYSLTVPRASLLT